MSTRLQSEDTYPPRPRAFRQIEGKTDSGLQYNARAVADAIPGTLDYGPFYGVGEVSVTSGSRLRVSVDFAGLGELIDLLVSIQDAASAQPGGAE